MTPLDVAPAIHLAYQRVTDSDPGSLPRESDMRALGLNSVQLLEMIVIIENELGLRIPDSALGSLDTIGDLCDVLEQLQPAHSQAG
ncbi:hypothetical protein GCM10010260_54000 [Streptomyces filipinensis]|uniref:Carrier domain-containing protein n=1 Tax=Streptomyces filipinensis TaxID=66887 RepID=A0A918IGA8_9ACTN|nr:acyl carrier protein [Streptomyces filipinensis]GGV09083.1 hypothetical protein GCM10010260_54000 [Streptomyces filipinensis]